MTAVLCTIGKRSSLPCDSLEPSRLLLQVANWRPIPERGGKIPIVSPPTFAPALLLSRMTRTGRDNQMMAYTIEAVIIKSLSQGAGFDSASVEPG
jgi:hypothetical protein